MNASVALERCPRTTDGEIAAINLQSARRRVWARFTSDPHSAGLAEAVVDAELLTAQFLGDPLALDRLEALASELGAVEESSRAALVQAQVASLAHRFEAARAFLASAALRDGDRETIERHTLAVDQACALDLDAVLAARRRLAGASGRTEDFVPLGAVLADLERFHEADAVYRKAFDSYDGTSPFLPAWICFQLGMLWGELAAQRDSRLAALWYRRAIAYLPCYAKAHVHLAEIYAADERLGDAEALLRPMLSSGDPEVAWRLADVLAAQGKTEEAETQLAAARAGFEDLLGRHLLAFADHAAEFYAGSGGDVARALELARANAANRPTRRAINQTQEILANARSMISQA
jgi:hypothetical protein